MTRATLLGRSLIVCGVLALLAGAFAAPARATEPDGGPHGTSVQGVVPVLIEGNAGVEQCPGGSTGTKFDPPVDATIDNITVTTDGVHLAWSDGNTGPYDVVAVLTKGGPNAYRYDYTPTPSFADDASLVAPLQGDSQPELSHYTICRVPYTPPPPPPTEPSLAGTCDLETGVATLVVTNPDEVATRILKDGVLFEGPLTDVANGTYQLQWMPQEVWVDAGAPVVVVCDPPPPPTEPSLAGTCDTATGKADLVLTNPDNLTVRVMLGDTVVTSLTDVANGSYQLQKLVNEAWVNVGTPVVVVCDAPSPPPSPPGTVAGIEVVIPTQLPATGAAPALPFFLAGLGLLTTGGALLRVGRRTDPFTEP